MFLCYFSSLDLNQVFIFLLHESNAFNQVWHWVFTGIYDSTDWVSVIIWLTGDGAGVGKGRTIAGIIYENYLHGRKRSLW